MSLRRPTRKFSRGTMNGKSYRHQHHCYTIGIRNRRIYDNHRSSRTLALRSVWLRISKVPESYYSWGTKFRQTISPRQAGLLLPARQVSTCKKTESNPMISTVMVPEGAITKL